MPKAPKPKTPPITPHFLAACHALEGLLAARMHPNEVVARAIIIADELVEKESSK